MVLTDRLRALVTALRQPGWRHLPPRAWMILAASLIHARPLRSQSGIIAGPDCPPLDHPAFPRWLRGFARLARGESLPLAAHVAVTVRCPNNCARCSQMIPGCQDPARNYLLGLINDLRKAGTASITFTGGEPLLRGDLEDLIADCGSDMAAMLYTAGQGLDDPRARSLRRAGLTAAHVSLDHHDASRHDAGRGRQGSAAEAQSAITALRRAGIHTAVRCVADEHLLLPGKMRVFLRHCRSLGAQEVVLLDAVPVRPGNGHHSLPASALRTLQTWQWRAAWDDELPVVTAMPVVEGPDAFGCQAGFSFCYIAVDGGVWPCDLAPCSLGNIHTDGLESVLKNLRRRFPRPRTVCLGRQLAADNCGTCRPQTGYAAEAMLDRCPADEPARLSRWLSACR